MEKRKFQIGVSDIILAAITVIYFIGALTFFKSCGPKDDGSWMTCHWAGNAVAGLAAVLAVTAIAHLVISNAKMKIGLSIALIPIAVLTALVPGHLIQICMMETMRCHVVMRPSAIVMAILIVAAAVFDIVVYRKKK